MLDMDYEKLLRRLCGIMSISGNERGAFEELKALLSDEFDEMYCDAARNIVLIKRSHKENRKKIMLDAHFDEVGMMVTGITDEGFLRVISVGGIDRQLLPASEVWVYGRERIYGVFAATPPHLAKPGQENKTPEWRELLIDIGCRDRQSAELRVSVGDYVGYYYSGEELLNRRITGRGFDDKSCAAGLIMAVCGVSRDELEYDVYITLSSGEEIGGGGAKCAAYSIRPELAIITDVNFAQTPGVSGEEGGRLEGGPMVSLSAVTDRALTKNIIALADRIGVSTSKTVEPTSTGTNASCVYCVDEGIPVAVVGIPLAGMHSYNELLSLDDADAFVRLFTEIVKTPELLA